MKFEKLRNVLILSLLLAMIQPCLAAVVTPTGPIGNFVWVDENRDGLQDANEPGIEGVKITLFVDIGFGILEYPTYTDSNGSYLTEELTAGTYYIDLDESTLPPGLIPTITNAGSDDTIDSDQPQNGDMVEVTLVNDGDEDLTIDFGFVYIPAALGDFVFEDLNENGIQDADEPGVPGVTVNLYDCDNFPVATTVTDIDGLYIFNNLNPGEYAVEFELPAGYHFTAADQGTDDALDSDADEITGFTACIPLEAGESNLTIDAGIAINLASLGDFVFEDLNNNGIQDIDEPGIPGVVVNLYDCDNVPVANTSTDMDGYYIFENLTPGGYIVEFELVNGYYFSTADQGDDDSLDSDADIISGLTSCITLEPGENNMTVDAGMVFDYEECSECDGKVTELTLQYNGDKTVLVSVYQKKSTTPIFTGELNPEDVFTIVGNDKHGTLGTEIYIYTLYTKCYKLNATIHTSCSEPIGPGLISGDFTVIEGYSKNGGLLCEIVEDDPCDNPCHKPCKDKCKHKSCNSWKDWCDKDWCDKDWDCKDKDYDWNWNWDWKDSDCKDWDWKSWYGKDRDCKDYDTKFWSYKDWDSKYQSGKKCDSNGWSDKGWDYKDWNWKK